MATHSSSLAWEIPWTEEFGGLQLMGLQELDKICNETNNNNNKMKRQWLSLRRLVKVRDYFCVIIFTALSLLFIKTFKS